MKEPTLLQIALEAADAESAGCWPTVAGILAHEYRELERENARLRAGLLFIRDECDWESGAFGAGGDNRIGPAIKDLLANDKDLARRALDSE